MERRFIGNEWERYLNDEVFKIDENQRIQYFEEHFKNIYDVMFQRKKWLPYFELLIFFSK